MTFYKCTLFQWENNISAICLDIYFKSIILDDLSVQTSWLIFFVREKKIIKCV